MIWFSAIVILANVVCLFCQADIVNTSAIVQDFIAVMPKWILENPQVIGLPPTSSSNNLKVFGTYLFFLIGSVYIKGEMLRWHEDESQIDLTCVATESLEGLADGRRSSSKKSGAIRRSSRLIKKSSSLRESENERTDNAQERLNKLH